MAKDGKNGEKYLRVKIHSKIHDQNPRRAPGETCCQNTWWRPGFYTELALRPPQTFEKISEFLFDSERYSEGGDAQNQFPYPLLRFGSQRRIPKLLFFLVFWVLPAILGFSAWDTFLLRRPSPENASSEKGSRKTSLACTQNLQLCTPLFPIRKPLVSPNSVMSSERKQGKFILNFGPSRVYLKPSFCYV